MFKLLGKLLDSNEKQIKKLEPLIAQINALEPKMHALKKSDFAKKTHEFKKRIADSTALDDVLIESFALVREAARRELGERPYDVQLMSAITLHQGKVAEQRTGEGKTLSASLPLYLNALTGKGVHLVTVNDYLARVGAGWMGSVYHLLGVSVSAMIHDQSFMYDPAYVDETANDWRLRFLRPISRKEAYEADITYGINSEFGFDYLRDNMVSDISRMTQREHHYAIVDEVDSVLIDEARTPHIISAPDTEPTKKYYDYARIVGSLDSTTDFEVDEKMRTAHLTESGINKVERLLGIENLYEKDFDVVHHIEAALKARTLFTKDKQYVVKDGQVVIVDEFTGRLLSGRRFSEGLHQAIEAKENVTIQRESRTLATVSLQNYFRMYQKLAGMTGTAATEAEEFSRIYDLDVVVIPTNKPIVRKDHSDVVYKTAKAKYDAVVSEIARINKTGQPVLVGTTSIENNELLEKLLCKKGLRFEVLNAKNHEREASIISNAGKISAVTVATNMAGRGVDIILGGMPPNKHLIGSDTKKLQKEQKEWEKAHAKVIKLGGLYVIGTERHESRRIDNQLRGRAGRQGDPGASRFFVSLEDDIMRIFGGDRVANLMTAFKLPEDMPLEHGMVTKAIEQAQIKVEGFHFDSRKHLVEYDDVINKQREIVYQRRRSILEKPRLKDNILEMLEDEINTIIAFASPEKGDMDREKIVTEFTTIIPFDESSRNQILKQLRQREGADITKFLTKLTHDFYEKREKDVTSEVMQQIERWVNLQVIDNLWMDHLTNIDDLRQGVGLRGYAQRDPLVEYKNEAFSMFERLIGQISYQVTRRLFRVHVHLTPQQSRVIEQQHKSQIAKTAEQAVSKRKQLSQKKKPQDDDSDATQKPRKKLGRNDPCWCGSGKKFKKCHYPMTSD